MTSSLSPTRANAAWFASFISGAHIPKLDLSTEDELVPLDHSSKATRLDRDVMQCRLIIDMNSSPRRSVLGRSLSQLDIIALEQKRSVILKRYRLAGKTVKLQNLRDVCRRSREIFEVPSPPRDRSTHATRSLSELGGLGAPLFERCSKGMMVTPLPSVRQALAAILNDVRRARSSSNCEEMRSGW
jgi:hypothetical protein